MSGENAVSLVHEPYAEQVKAWPKDGRHVLAQYDTESIVVYQAYSSTIGRYAAEHGRFGGDFRFSRMSMGEAELPVDDVRSVGRSAVRLQWDPDHHPSGAKLDRRAIQLGLRGPVLEAFGTTELLEVIDLSEFVAAQREVLAARGTSALLTPHERVYVPADPSIAVRLRLATEPMN